MRIFKMNMFNSSQMLSISYEPFMNLFKNEIDPKILASLYQKKCEYNLQKEFYVKIEDNCKLMMKEGMKIADKVMDAYVSGKLKMKEHDGGKYWIEDTETGSGLCFMEKGDYIYMSRRNNFICYSEPAKIVNKKSQVTVFSMLNKTVTWD